MFNLIFLKTFVTLARTNSFRNTARVVSITQSAVSQQIHSLESKVGCRLFERAGKQIELTHSGEVFMIYAQNILNQYEDALLHIKNQNNSISGTIKIATIYSIGLYRLQPIIRAFLKKYPEVNVHLEYYHNDIIYEKVLNRTLDFGFVAFPKKKEGLNIDHFADDLLVLIQCKQRPVFKTKSIKFADLKDKKYVALLNTTPTGKEINRVFRQHGVQPEVVHGFENVETLKSAVLVGMGCSIVPKNILSQEMRDRTIEIVDIKDASLTRSIGILSPKVKVLTKAKQKFLDAITSSSS